MKLLQIIFNITPEVKLKPIKLNKPPVINSEKPIFLELKEKSNTINEYYKNYSNT